MHQLQQRITSLHNSTEHS